MNRTELRTMLETITPHEILYQNGHADEVPLEFSYRKVHGVDTPYSPISSSPVFRYGPLFSLRRHSRFLPFPPHCHDGLEINYMYAGTCDQTVNGQPCHLEEGQVLFLNLDTVHEIAPLGKSDILMNINLNIDYLTGNFLTRFACESILTHFLVSAITDSIRHDAYLIFCSEDNERLRGYFENLFCQWYDPSIVARDIIENLMSLILSELVLAYGNTLEAETTQGSLPVTNILRYISEHYQTCTLNDAAKHFHLSPNYLSNCLKKQTGSSYRELVQEQKLSVAEQLLRTSSLSVAEIVHVAGYENLTFFYRKFKERNGCLPNEYRAQTRK